MSTQPKLNLLTDPWIRVVDKNQQVGFVSPLDIPTGDYRSISAAEPSWEVGQLEFLIFLFQTLLPPSVGSYRDDWVPTREELLRIIDRLDQPTAKETRTLTSCFDLFGENYRFGQVSRDYLSEAERVRAAEKARKKAAERGGLDQPSEQKAPPETSNEDVDQGEDEEDDDNVKTEPISSLATLRFTSDQRSSKTGWSAAGSAFVGLGVQAVAQALCGYVFHGGISNGNYKVAPRGTGPMILTARSENGLWDTIRLNLIYPEDSLADQYPAATDRDRMEALDDGLSVKPAKICFSLQELENLRRAPEFTWGQVFPWMRRADQYAWEKKDYPAQRIRKVGEGPRTTESELNLNPKGSYGDSIVQAGAPHPFLFLWGLTIRVRLVESNSKHGICSVYGEEGLILTRILQAPAKRKEYTFGTVNDNGVVLPRHPLTPFRVVKKDVMSLRGTGIPNTYWRWVGLRGSLADRLNVEGRSYQQSGLVAVARQNEIHAQGNRGVALEASGILPGKANLTGFQILRTKEEGFDPMVRVGDIDQLKDLEGLDGLLEVNLKVDKLARAVLYQAHTADQTRRSKATALAAQQELTDWIHQNTSTDFAAYWNRIHKPKSEWAEMLWGRVRGKLLSMLEEIPLSAHNTRTIGMLRRVIWMVGPNPPKDWGVRNTTICKAAKEISFALKAPSVV